MARAPHYRCEKGGELRRRCGCCFTDLPVLHPSLKAVKVADVTVGFVCESCVDGLRTELGTKLVFPYFVDEKCVIDAGELALINDRRASVLAFAAPPAEPYEPGDEWETPNDES